MLRLRPSNLTPPDSFQFRFSDGHTVYAIDRNDWRDKAHAYARDNNLPVPSDEEMEDYLCRRLSGEFCIGGSDATFINPRFSADDFLRGTKVLASFIMSGASLVSPEVAQERARVCSQCVANMTVQGCGTCHGVANAIAEAKGAQGTKYDHLLKACGVCKCSNEAQVWLPAEYLSKGVTPEMMAQYEQIPECWKRDEIKSLL